MTARFEVAGGNYRLIASFDFRRQIVFVKFIGTHAEYDAIDALTVARFDEDHHANPPDPHQQKIDRHTHG